MKKTILIILSVIFCNSIFCQNRMDEINKIKRDSNYLYGEATLNTKDAALGLAYELLEVEIKNWAKAKNSEISSVVASEIRNYVDTIVTKRHNMIRVFAYVNISNLNPVTGNSITVTVDEDRIKDNETNSNKPLETTSSEDKGESSTPKETSNINPQIERQLNEKQDIGREVITEIQKLSSFYDLEKTIKPLYQQGKIESYGKYSTMSDPENSYLIIYDVDANIRAILGKGSSIRKNLSTGKDDSEKNYKGCGAIWFKVKE